MSVMERVPVSEPVCNGAKTTVTWQARLTARDELQLFAWV